MEKVKLLRVLVVLGEKTIAQEVRLSGERELSRVEIWPKVLVDTSGTKSIVKV